MLGFGACLALGSCSLLVDVSGLSGAAAPASDASTTGESDGPAVEGAVDAHVDGAKAAGFCASADAGFCDDFDEPTRSVLVGSWDQVDFAAGGASVLDMTSPRSPPRYARFTWAANVTPPATGCNYSRLYRSVATQPTSRLRFSFAAWLGDASGGLAPRDYVASLGWATASASCGLLWKPSRPNGSLYEQNPAGAKGHGLPSGPTAGSWHRYTIDVDLVSGALRFEIDDTNVLADTETVSSTCPTAPTRVSTTLGFYCAGNNPSPSEVRFDDVTLDAR